MICLKKVSPRYILVVILGIIAGVVSSNVIFSTTGFSLFGVHSENPPSYAGMDNADLAALAFEVLEYIRDGDFEALAEITHPDFGVVFSPSATITLAANRRFTAEQIAQFATDNTIYVWGINDIGEPIELTPVDYFARFVFSSDYFSASMIGINRIVRSGNALENITEEFPGVRFVDFHIPGEDRYPPDELDWSSLRLGFEEHEDKLWLTVIVHSRWTV